jgi:hypothetical protein
MDLFLVVVKVLFIAANYMNFTSRHFSVMETAVNDYNGGN